MSAALTSSTGMRLAALRATKELAAVSDTDLGSLLRYADEVSMPAGTVVARAGDYCAQLVVVMEGTIRVQSPVARRLLGAGDACGWEAMWERSANRSGLVVESDARLLVFSRDQFRAIKALVEPETRWACTSETGEVQIVA